MDNMTPGLYFFYVMSELFADWVLLIITIFIFLTFDPVLGFQFATTPTQSLQQLFNMLDARCQDLGFFVIC